MTAVADPLRPSPGLVRRSGRARQTGALVELVDVCHPTAAGDVLVAPLVAAFDGLRWAAVCRDHGSTSSWRTMLEAGEAVGSPGSWCPGCRAIFEPVDSQLELVPGPVQGSAFWRAVARRARAKEGQWVRAGTMPTQGSALAAAHRVRRNMYAAVRYGWWDARVDAGAVLHVVYLGDRRPHGLGRLELPGSPAGDALVLVQAALALLDPDPAMDVARDGLVAACAELEAAGNLSTECG